jgi:hypothetical protein
MRGAVPPLPQYVLMAWYLIKHRDIFTIFLYASPVYPMTFEPTSKVHTALTRLEPRVEVDFFRDIAF